MIEGIDKISNKDRIAIVAVGYNRPKALSRLLDSVSNAQYEVPDVPLVISIDASGNQELYDFVNEYQWNHGQKYVNIQSERLGLKDHIFQCMSLSCYFKGVIILEDDIFVSPFFYHYAITSLEKYGNDNRVAGIALYTNEYDGGNGVPIQYLNNGYDVFAWQECCTWGELFNERMWDDFSTWMKHFNDDFTDIDISETIKKWPRAWSKYMMAYLAETNRFFIFPYVSVTTNFNDAGGEHGGGDSSLVQVSLLQGKKKYQLGDFDELVHYDCYLGNLEIADWIGVNSSELTVDFYGGRTWYKSRYVLTPFDLPYKKMRGYRLCMRPWELNVKYGIDGCDLFLYDRETTKPEIAPRREYSFAHIIYFIGRYKQNLKPHFLSKLYVTKLKRKLGL